MRWYVYEVHNDGDSVNTSKRPVGRVDADDYDEALDAAVAAHGPEVMILDRQMMLMALRARRLSELEQSRSCKAIMGVAERLLGKETRLYWGVSKVVSAVRTTLA